MTSTLIRNATVISLDSENRVFRGSVLVCDGVIESLDYDGAADRVIEADGKVLIPGFVQTHIHLCQTLFRGSADDLLLLDWLKTRVWPLEAAHDAASLTASAELGIAELLKGGTTCALTMETVRHTEVVLQAVDRSGFRAVVGKCLMDQGEGVPTGLFEPADEAIAEALDLAARWHGKAGGRIQVCLAPRFALSCSRELLERVAKLSEEHGLIIHTHASENRTEIVLVRAQTGQRNILYLDDVGLVGEKLVLAHCVWVDEEEIAVLKKGGVKVSHCPSSNLKLGSGIARVVELMEQGVSVSLGADGAPCNNRLDMFTEMRTAALLQKVRRGPQAMPALQVLRMATIEGARALGLDKAIGSIEAGKRADLVLVNLEELNSVPHPDPVSALVYSAQPNQVETVMVDGNLVVHEGKLLTLDEVKVRRAAQEQIQVLHSRAFGGEA